MSAGAGSDGGGDFLPSRTGPRSIVIRCDAAASTAAEVGAAAVAPVDIAGTNVQAVAGTNVQAVAEVHSSVVDDEGDRSVVRTGRQRSAVILDPMEEIYVLKPPEHLVPEVSLEGGDCFDS